MVLSTLALPQVFIGLHTCVCNESWGGSLEDQGLQFITIVCATQMAYYYPTSLLEKKLMWYTFVYCELPYMLKKNRFPSTIIHHRFKYPHLPDSLAGKPHAVKALPSLPPMVAKY